MSALDASLARWRDNPFFVLGLTPECTRADMERQGQKLLGMLELGVGSVKMYATPVGTAERTADKVRAAMAMLRDPDQRLVHEFWARAPVEPLDKSTSGQSNVTATTRTDGPWGGAMDALGWKALRSP